MNTFYNINLKKYKIIYLYIKQSSKCGIYSIIFIVYFKKASTDIGRSNQ